MDVPPHKRQRVEPVEHAHDADVGKDKEASGQAEPASDALPSGHRFSLDERVVYTPAIGRPELATVRFVGEVDGRSMYGIETDEVVEGSHDGQHPRTGERCFRCEAGHGLYVAVGSSRLRSVAQPLSERERSEAARRRVVQGLEAMSESDALRLARLQKLAESSLRSEAATAGREQDFRKCWDPASGRYIFLARGDPTAPCRRLPRSASVSSIEGGPEADLEQLPGYNGPRLPTLAAGRVAAEEAHALFQHVASHYTEPLPCGLLLALVQAARALLLREPSVLRLRTPPAPAGRLVVVGDTHGHLKDLVHIWRKEGLPSRETHYLFNGDICDRGDSDKRGGQQALHIWACVLGFKLAHPGCVFINRGNHEDGGYWTQYGPVGFSGEIESKYARKEADQLIDAFASLCDALPLAAVVEDSCLVLHGGLPRNWRGKGAIRLEEVGRCARPLPMPASDEGRVAQMLYDLMWADPQEDKGIGANARGGDIITFGPDVTASFLQAESLGMLVRSHEVPGRQEEFRGRGFEWWHPLTFSGPEPLCEAQRGWCLTVFSASDYCGQCNNPSSHLVFHGSVRKFSLVEHTGYEAERTLLDSSLVPPRPLPKAEEERCLAQAALDRGVVAAIVEHKHQLLSEFMAVDKLHDWFLEADAWVACSYRVLPLIPWEDYLDEPSIVPMQHGRVPYTRYLMRYQIQMHNKLGLHAGFRRRLTNQLFEGLLRADYTLRETLEAVDLDGDGTVSPEEFASALARFGKVLTEPQAKTLYRTTVVPEGNVKVEDFLGALSLRFALTHPRATDVDTDFIPTRLDAICREILDVEGGPSASQSVAVTLRCFFERADSRQDGYLSPAEFIAAVRPLRSCSGLSDQQLEAIANYIDLNGDAKINYVELLKALCVNHADTADSRQLGPKVLLEDMLEAVHRVLHFEYSRPLRTLMRRMLPPGCTRCTPATFTKALAALNGSAGGTRRLSEAQIQCLAETLDTDVQPPETEGHFDYEDFLRSFRIVDTLADESEDYPSLHAVISPAAGPLDVE